MSDSLRPHESQHARPPYPSPTPRVHSDSRPSSQWCHPAISSSVVPFSSCPQSLPAWVFSNESALHMRWPKYWSFSFSIIPSKETPGLISREKCFLSVSKWHNFDTSFGLISKSLEKTDCRSMNWGGGCRTDNSSDASVPGWWPNWWRMMHSSRDDASVSSNECKGITPSPTTSCVFLCSWGMHFWNVGQSHFWIFFFANVYVYICKLRQHQVKAI